jgi:prepilin-type processing-associated H-X9-DG protein
MDGRFLQGTFTATRKVNDEKPDVDCGGAGGLSALRGLGDGINMALCDGSVRFLNAKISLTTWKAAATRGGGEVLGADF